MNDDTDRNAEQKITLTQLDTILSPVSPVTYWQDGMPVQRRDIFDDCEVVSVGLDNQSINGRPSPQIAVYVGERVGRGNQ